MKKLTKELSGRSIKEIQNDERVLRSEIGKLSLEFQVNQSKDTNSVYKKKKKLAVLLTILNQKKQEELLSKETKQVKK